MIIAYNQSLLYQKIKIFDQTLCENFHRFNSLATILHFNGTTIACDRYSTVRPLYVHASIGPIYSHLY